MRDATQRWCKREDDEHAKLTHDTFLNFAQERFDYVYDIAQKQIPLIEEKFSSKIKSGELIFRDGKKQCSLISYYQFKHGHVAVICEQCGDLCTFVHSYCHGMLFAQVHHKNPVCMVTVETIMSIFDHSNFILLCMKCHGKSHPWRKHQAPLEKKYVTLDTFFK